MKAPFTTYRVIRIDGSYDTDATDENAAKEAAVESFIKECRKHA